MLVVHKWNRNGRKHKVEGIVENEQDKWRRKVEN